MMLSHVRIHRKYYRATISNQALSQTMYVRRRYTHTWTLSISYHIYLSTKELHTQNTCRIMNMYIVVSIKHTLLQSGLKAIGLCTSRTFVSSKRLITNWKLQDKHETKPSFAGPCCRNNAVSYCLMGNRRNAARSQRVKTIFHLISMVDTATPLCQHGDLWISMMEKITIESNYDGRFCVIKYTVDHTFWLYIIQFAFY